MIVLDTNVISEMMRPRPHPGVLRWSAEAGQLHTTSITVAEMEYGVARLPEGRRRAELSALVTRFFADFAELVLSFDLVAARRYGPLVARCDSVGRPISSADAQIAAVCLTHGAVLATRNVADFENAGLELVDPWEQVPDS